ncbi:MAG: DnaA ATPase domain-containing protein [Nitrospinota bacterium]
MNPRQLWLDFPKANDYQLTNFLVCGKNEIAFKASQSITENTSDTFLNPLIIVGGAGSGKTHLLYGIANQVKARSPKLFIHAVSLRDLLGRYQKTTSYAQVASISDEYKSADLLLIDDVHLCEDSEPLQEQVFHIFNEVIRRGKRVVLSSRHSPDELTRLEGYLKSRLLTGASVRISSSGDVLRQAILKKIALDLFLKLSDMSARHITTHITRDISQFTPVVKKISDYSFKTGKKVTPALIKELFQKDGVVPGSV